MTLMGYILLGMALAGLASGGVADAFSFRSPSRSHAYDIPSINDARSLLLDHSNPLALPTSSSKRYQQKHDIRLLLSKSDDDDAAFAAGMETLDTDLAREIEEALSLAQDAMQDASVVETDEDSAEEDIDEIANMLMEKPPSMPLPLPLPPKEDPPESVISLSLDEAAAAEAAAAKTEAAAAAAAKVEAEAEAATKAEAQAVARAEAEAAAKSEAEAAAKADAKTKAEAEAKAASLAAFFAETLQKKVAEEIGKLKNMIPGREEQLKDVKASTDKEEEIASVLKKEIKDSIQEREAMVKRIEEEFAKEKELLIAQMEVASDELKVVMDQSAQNITEAKENGNKKEDAWIDRLDSLKSAIDEAAAEVIDINSDKDKIKQSKQSLLDKALMEGKSKLVQFTKSLDVDVDYAKQINADFKRRADEAESLVRGAFDQINQMQTDQVSLQQQIVDVEKKALDDIESLKENLKLDDERYATALEKERVRLDEVIDEAFQAYAIKVCKKITEREAVEAGYKDKVRNIDMQITAAREKQESRVKEYLDKLEGKHKKERIAVYQEKFEAISAIRKEMKDELAVEEAKIEEIHETMKPQVDAVNKQIAQVKADFERDMSEKQHIAKEEEGEVLREIEDVRVVMTDKIKTQRRLYDDKKDKYLDDMNGKISDSETQLRQAWSDIAVIKKSHGEVSAKRDNMIDDVAEKQALINSYEGDRESFRKSLRLTAKLAREKIGSKTKRLLGRGKKKA